MTPTSSQIAHAITLRGLGITIEEPAGTSSNKTNALGCFGSYDPAGIFDDFHRMEVEALKAENRFLRSNIREGEAERREQKTRNRCLILLALFGWGLFFIAAVGR